MDSLILVVVILFWLCVFLGLVNIYQYKTKKKVLTGHLNEVIVERSFLGKPEKTTRISKLIAKLSKYADDFSALGERINFFSESSDLAVLLKKAGYPYELTVGRLQGAKIVFFILGFLAGATSVILGLPFSNILFVALPFAGFFVPILWIRSKAKERQNRLRRDLPDFLDTVTISLQAGAGLDQAIRETINHFEGPIRQEFSRLMSEISIGVPREKAYKDMLERNDNPDFQNFIKALLQGTKLGVPVATTFRIQSEEIRKVSIEQVKEKAAKASPKVTLITSFVIAPTIMLFILGLVVLNLIYGDNNILDML
ncbi:Bacterial type II secretion system protein F domain protein [Bacillus sp. THAF10]|uniref:type II secretion system F family protein n=1 Tax=Bacillus sp. THAF10 TaxID=2587848 RepID=UPI0012697F10|nr:type II secretion system F family protein [Bacillus sp. THAF10]QFT87762.1 Bacterial type II secretion system protein F domain protein [Bacillus sp. THAF10]